MTSTRFFIFFISAVLLLIGSFFYAITLGSANITFADSLNYFINNKNTEDWQQTIIYHIRLPRVCLAGLVGATLAICGAILQSLFKNPLASPSVLGVTSGASLGAVITIFMGWSAISIWVLPISAFIGAACTLLLVYALSTYRGRTPVGTLLLAGVAISTLTMAISSLLLALALHNWEVGKAIVYWTMGGLDARSWTHVSLLLPVFLIGCFITAFFSRDLDILTLGEIHASTVGVAVQRTRLYLLITTALMTGAAVAVAGSIGFIGLVVPHICRLFVGTKHYRLIPTSAVVGALLLIIADTAIRSIPSMNAIPLGVITASFGAPFFIFLLAKQRHLLQI